MTRRGLMATFGAALLGACVYFGVVTIALAVDGQAWGYALAASLLAFASGILALANVGLHEDLADTTRELHRVQRFARQVADTRPLILHGARPIQRDRGSVENLALVVVLVVVAAAFAVGLVGLWRGTEPICSTLDSRPPNACEQP